uniref:Uncharacterized protein n=1 Tax=Strix occidentalis caurina TaxID=311401 RepID=A0A8D0F454_STROC
ESWCPGLSYGSSDTATASAHTTEGVPDRIFRTLKDLIYTFEKPDQGLIINLRYPVKKQKVSQRKSGAIHILLSGPAT